MYMRRITLSSGDSLAVDPFYTLSYKQHNFLRKLMNVKRVLIFYTNLSAIFIVLSTIELGIIVKVYMSSRKVSVILV